MFPLFSGESLALLRIFEAGEFFDGFEGLEGWVGHAKDGAPGAKKTRQTDIDTELEVCMCT